MQKCGQKPYQWVDAREMWQYDWPGLFTRVVRSEAKDPVPSSLLWTPHPRQKDSTS